MFAALLERVSSALDRAGMFCMVIGGRRIGR